MHTTTCPRVSVRVEGCDVNTLEEAVYRQREEFGRRAFRELLTKIEGKTLKKFPRTCGCGGHYENKGKEPRKIQSWVGTVSFSRTRMRCATCGTQRYPLDEAIGLEKKQQETLRARERALWFATELSYERAAEGLREMCAIHVSHGQIKHLVDEEGERLRQEDQKRQTRLFEDADALSVAPKVSPTVFIEVDGTAIHNRRTGTSMECKVGIIYSQKAQVSKDRVRILDKRTYASLEEAEQFKEKFLVECARWGLPDTDTQRIMFIGDGAAWIRKLREDEFPGSVYILDWWHLERKVRETLGEEEERAIQGILHVAIRGQPETVCQRLTRVYQRTRDAPKRAHILDLIDYVRSNAEGIRNYVTTDFLGSGAIEKSVDITVCRRFKTRGMSWYWQGAGNLLRLRLLKLNDEWRTYWQERIDEATQSP
jgi:hypothetical protein